MSDSPVSIRKEGKVTVITMDDGKANVFGFALIDGLNAAFDEIDPNQGAVVIEGREGRYSAGFDLGVFATQNFDDISRMLTGGTKVALRAFDFPRPIVAAVGGHAVAMGAIFNMGLDWRIGAKGNYKHGLNEVKDGLILPAFAVELPRFRLNPMRYQEAVLRSQLYTPDEAIDVGFLDEVVEREKLMEAALAKAEALSAYPNPAYSCSKRRDRAQVKQHILDNLDEDVALVIKEQAGG